MAANFIAEFKKNFEDQPTKYTKKLANVINSVLDKVILGLIPVGSGSLLITTMTAEFGESPLPDGLKLMNAIGAAIDASQVIYVPSVAAFSAGTVPSKLKAGTAVAKSLMQVSLADWMSNDPSLLDPLLSTIVDTIANAYPQGVRAVG